MPLRGRVTTTELARNLRQILDNVARQGQEVLVIRNNQLIARIVPGVQEMTALEAMSDLYKTISPDAGDTWVEDSRKGLEEEVSTVVKNPWDS